MSTPNLARLFFIPTMCLLCTVISVSGQSNYINQGNAALKQGDQQGAQEFYEQAILHCNQDGLVDENMAVLLATSGDIDGGIDLINKRLKKDKDNGVLLYNRALMYLSKKDFEKALVDFQQASVKGAKASGEMERQAKNLKRQSEEKQIETLLALAESKRDQQKYDQAKVHYDQALGLRPNDKHILFEIANLGLIQKNPFVTIEALDKLPKGAQTEEQKVESTLLKAYSLARINKMKEAVRLLEQLAYQSKITDFRPRELLSYFYLKLSKHDESLRVIDGQIVDNANAYIVAGNSAIHMKRYRLAFELFKRAESFDQHNTNMKIGKALCLTQLHKNEQAIKLIDSLAIEHPGNHLVMNIKGIIYKDIGLYYKNNFREQTAKTFFVKSAAAFLTAKTISDHLKKEYDSNMALALFYQDKKDEAQDIWSENEELSSQNNLALLFASQRNYTAAYTILDKLYSDYFKRKKKKSSLIEYNRGLARSKTRLNNNYKFVTNFLLNQDRPELNVTNPFSLENSQPIDSSQDFEYLLSYSDDDCIEKVSRKKGKKKKRTRLPKRKKKKQKGSCPTFN